MITEQQYQKKITSFLEERGYFVIKLISTNKNGIPDLLAVHPLNANIWIEVKKTDGVLRPLQEFRIRELSKFNQVAFCAYGFEHFKEQYKHIRL